MENGSMGEDEVRVVVGLALEYSYLYCEKCVQGLWPLLRNPDLAQIERIATEFVRDSDDSVRHVGHLLQAAFQNNLPDPDPIDCRDLTLDMLQQELRLADYMYQIKNFEGTMKRPLDDICCSLRDWANSLGAAVSMMRKQDWIRAKVHIDEAYASSLSVNIASGICDIYKEAILSQQERTRGFRNTVLGYPSKLHIPQGRTTMILKVQSAYLRLLQICQPDSKLGNATLYVKEKLTVAIARLLSADREIKTANYEVGLAAGELKRLAQTFTSPVSTVLKEISDELDLIFSELPAEPWPINSALAFGGSAARRCR